MNCCYFERILACAAASLALLLGALLCSPARAQFEDDDEFRAGLVAEVTTDSEAAGARFRRVDATPFAAGAKSETSSVRWTGYLMSQATGEYRLYAYAAGEVQVKLGDQVLLAGSREEPGWIDGKSLELPFDWHPLEIIYKPNGAGARFSLYWSGPKFQLEPVSPRQFYHDPEQTPPGDYERGKLLSRAFRCAACHQTPDDSPAMPAPALDRLAGNVRLDWLVDRLQDAASSQDREASSSDDMRKMPHFGFSESQARAMATYLLSASKPPRRKNSETPSGDARAGQRTFLTRGCLACHRMTGLGESGLFGGGDLSLVADKRPAGFFADWLAAPEKINKHHRMPVFELTRQERNDLASYLATREIDSTDPESDPEVALDTELIAAGKQLYQQRRCAACHDPDSDAGKQTVARRTRLSPDSNWDRSCTDQPDAGAQRPGYLLSQNDRAALLQYFTQSARQGAARADHGERLLMENNCLACHARDGGQGIADNLAAILESHPELAVEAPALTPPPLTSVGDKLRDEALRDIITDKSGVRRPWLEVRMPKFRLSDDETAGVIAHLVQSDRIPPRDDLPTPPEESPRLDSAGARLVSTSGFGCVSCHEVGKYKPPKAPLNARGPNLALLSERVRYEWFDRWVRNPARIVPRMEMPSMQLPVRGVLDNHLDDQLAAVWRVLNRPGFRPPPPDAVRVVRKSGIRERNESATALTDVLQVGDDEYIKPLLIALPNRHNLLFDLAANRLAGWWMGDAARQRTKGKTWYWEAGGESLLVAAPMASDIAIRRGKRVLQPALIGQFPTEFDELRHEAGGLTFTHRLRLSDAARGNAPEVLHVSQSTTPIWPSANSAGGVRRDIRVAGLRETDEVVFTVAKLEDSSRAAITGNGRVLQLPGDSSAAIAIHHLAEARFSRAGEQVVVLARADGANGPVHLALDYLAGAPADQFPVVAPKPPAPAAVELHVASGFKSTRLPIAEDIMPTALAWRPNGDLVVASLKGRVWIARDTDNDGLEDQIGPLGDELAAPFGLATGENHIDVVTKYALLRLFDEDGDGECERTVTLASGWGHTADYHDWTIGLPRDEQGNYYLAIPCQQDDRSLAAARLRGAVVKLAPREPTAADPRPFEIQPISGGHRFPIGIARSRDGDLFVTDNQGNYNPFNELNHVVPGARYGFINTVERKPGFKPPLTPPAIDIPHPWTRSVNGVCFLDTPPDIRRQRGALFGPFEGHLVGCEYDTRLLIRMSLERVNGVFQGAAYPLTYYHPQDGNTLLGPLACAVSPAGDLYIGSIRDSGWGGANNIGALVRMSPRMDQLEPGIAEVRAAADGFVIDFTAPVDRALAADVKNYTVSSYTRVSTPAYGGKDEQRRVDRAAGVKVENDGRRAVLKLNSLRAGFVYEIRLKNLAGKGKHFFPAEAYYTMRNIPR